jgi:DNA-binding transcriptional regulator YdaS (Cro superfamily)
MDKALQEAIRRAGTATELARRLGIAKQAIYQWDRAPIMRVLAIEKLTGVSRHLLRPDIYGYGPPIDATKQDA